MKSIIQKTNVRFNCISPRELYRFGFRIAPHSRHKLHCKNKNYLQIDSDRINNSLHIHLFSSGFDFQLRNIS